MKIVLSYTVTILISLLACAGFSIQAAAELAPVEDQSTTSPTATSQGEAQVGEAQESYSNDLRVPFGGRQIPGSQNSSITPNIPERDSIERPAFRPVESGASGNTQLFYKVQVLEQEIRELRGLLEEQAHQLSRLAREQKDQYLDIDRRLSQAARDVQGSATTTTASPSPSSSGVNLGPTTSDVTAAVGADPESRDYNVAFALTREKRYQEAIDAFTELVNDYPNGTYTGNSFYWLGELYLALENPDIEKSRQSFVQVVNLFPDHTKVPDSLYKLGVVYHRLGDLIRARQYLNQVTSQYPASASARLAKSYLADLP